LYSFEIIKLICDQFIEKNNQIVRILHVFNYTEGKDVLQEIKMSNSKKILLFHILSGSLMSTQWWLL